MSKEMKEIIKKTKQIESLFSEIQSIAKNLKENEKSTVGMIYGAIISITDIHSVGLTGHLFLTEGLLDEINESVEKRKKMPDNDMAFQKLIDSFKEVGDKNGK